MSAAPLPFNEAERLQALAEYDILDTINEVEYDDITYLASHICGAPIAAITLIDKDRQWMKSTVGLTRGQTTRDHAFCAHTILNPNQVMIVTDATTDQRFLDNPLVLDDPMIRFYAGAPLVTPNGEALGALCVIDRAPRELTKDQLRALSALSRQVMGQLELRKSMIHLRRTMDERAVYERKLEAYQKKLESINADLSVASQTDKLTKLSNRGSFDEFMTEEFDRARRRDRPLSLLLLDVDHFKKFNDNYGHSAGDEVLRQVASILQDSIRPTDFVARYGGEEFAVLLPNAAEEEAQIVAERIRRAIQNNPWREREVTVSIGCCTLIGPAEMHEMISCADEGLYKSKADGRNRVTVASLGG